MYWARELANQNDDEELKNKFTEIAETLSANESTIIDQLNGAQGKPMNVGGYYFRDDELASAAMRPILS